jgi:hypothetical protein
MLACCLLLLLGAAVLRAEESEQVVAQRAYQTGGFVYLEDHRVRVEILVPLSEVGSVYPPAESGEAEWSAERQASKGPLIGSVLEAAVAMTINGQSVMPEETRVVFVDMRAPMTPSPDKPTAISTEWGAVGVILPYVPRAGTVSEVEVAFTGFSGGLTQLPVRILSRSEESGRLLTPRQNRLMATHRRGEGAVARGQVSSAGRDLSQAEDMDAALLEILQNVYHAFEYGRDEDVYDALARTVSGELLQRVYLDVRRSLVMEQEGGASASVRGISIKEVQLVSIEGSTTALNATWQVEGTLEHWGHVHARTNEYSGRVALNDEKGFLKLVELRIDRHERVEEAIRERVAAP